MLYQILITEENIEDFKAVLPKGIIITPERISLGCYDEEGTVLGAISFTMISYEYEIDWLYVVPQGRRKGVATGLMERFFDFMKKTGEIYPVSAGFEVSDEDRSLLDFFHSVKDLNVSYSHDRFYISYEEITDSKELNERMSGDYDERLFFKLDDKEQEKILKDIENDEIFEIDDFDRWREDCIPNSCRVIYKADKPEGAIFIRRRRDGKLELTYLYSKNPICTKRLVCLTASDIVKMGPGNDLVFDTVVPKTDMIARRLFPNSRAVSIYKAD